MSQRPIIKCSHGYLFLMMIHAIPGSRPPSNSPRMKMEMSLLLIQIFGDCYPGCISLMITLHILGLRVFVYFFISSVILGFSIFLWVVSSFPHYIAIIICAIFRNDLKYKRFFYTGALSTQCKVFEIPGEKQFSPRSLFLSLSLFFFLFIFTCMAILMATLVLTPISIFISIIMCTSVSPVPLLLPTFGVDSSVPQKQKQKPIKIDNFYGKDGAEEIDIFYGQLHQSNETPRPVRPQGLQILVFKY